MQEITIHGRGGQGAVTAAQIMAIAAFYDGKQSQAFPMYGVERSGAPVQAYCRIAKKPVNIRSQVYFPDFAVVLDPTLLKTVDITSGLKKDSFIIVNSKQSAKELGIKYKNTFIVDATSVALEIFKKGDLVNTSMLGAFSAITNLVSLKSLLKAIAEKFEGKPELIEKNRRAITEIYNRCRI